MCHKSKERVRFFYTNQKAKDVILLSHLIATVICQLILLKFNFLYKGKKCLPLVLLIVIVTIQYQFVSGTSIRELGIGHCRTVFSLKTGNLAVTELHI